MDFTKSACGFWGSIPTLPVMAKLAAIRLFSVRRGASCDVVLPVPLPPSNARNSPLCSSKDRAFYHVGQVFVILEPEFLRRDNGFRVRRVFCFFWNRLAAHAFSHNRAASSGRRRRRWGKSLWNPLPLQMRMAAGIARNMALPLVFQLRAHLGGRAGAKKSAAVHDGHARRKGERFFQTMFGQDDRRTEFAVDLAEGGEEVRRGNGVKLARRFVEDQDFRLKHHHGREVQELLLPAGQLCDRLIKPRPESRRNLPFPQHGGESSACHSRGIPARTPARARPCRSRSDSPDFAAQSRLFPPVRAGLRIVKISALKQDFAVSAAMRREDGFELPEQR